MSRRAMAWIATWARGAALVAMVGFAMFVSGAAFGESTKPIRMRVVESGTGTPVAGASVRYFAEAHEGTLTGHGGRSVTMFEIRTESDEGGNIVLPPTRFNPRIFGHFGLNTNYGNATMTITRKGYQTLQISNYLRIIPNLQEVIEWMYDGQTVELKPLRHEGPVPGG